MIRPKRVVDGHEPHERTGLEVDPFRARPDLPSGYITFLLEVINTGVNGYTAYNALEFYKARGREFDPDLVLMDLVMPVMNGVEATRGIMANSPCPVLVTTATLTGNCELVYDALGAGAVDAVETPVLGSDGQLRGLRERVGWRADCPGWQFPRQPIRSP